MKLPAIPESNKYRILVVEDDPTIAKLVSLQLNMAGFDIRLATDGLEGWTAFLEINPHLILADISMPGLSGHELTTKVRVQSGIPIILMTAANTDESEMEGFKSGADDYISKPFNPKLLVARVVANLRRVYRYNPATAPAPVRPPARPTAPAPAEEVVPDGWTQCDACSYMGPEFKFERIDPNGNKVLICPNCHNRSVTFSIG